MLAISIVSRGQRALNLINNVRETRWFIGKALQAFNYEEMEAFMVALVGFVSLKTQDVVLCSSWWPHYNPRDS